LPRKRESEPYRCPSALVMRQKHHTDNGPDTDSGQHRPQSPREGEQPAANHGLPDICDKGRCAGVITSPSKPIDTVGKPRTDHTFDETRQQKSPGNGGEN